MEESNGRTIKIEVKQETDDWRAEVAPDMRYRIVKRLVSLMRSKLPAPDAACQMTKMCLQLEKFAFCNAATKDVYLQMINKQMMQMDQSNCCNVAASSSSPGLPQTSIVAGAKKSSSLQNVQWVSHNCAGGSVGQGKQSNISAITQREIPGYQPLQKVAYQQLQMQDLQHQFLNPNVHQPNISTSLIQLGMQNNHRHRQLLEDTSSKQKLQQSMQPVQFYQLLDSQNESEQEAMQQKLQILAALLWPRNVVNQQQLIPSPRALAEVLYAASELANIAEWHDQAYQMVQSLKEEYVPRLRQLLPRLKELCDSWNVMCRVSLQPEVLRHEARKLIDLLSMSRRDIVQFSESSFEFFQKTMIKFLYILQQYKTYSVQQQTQFQPPGGPYQICEHNSYQQQLKHQMMQPQNFKQHIQPHLTQQKVQQMLMKNIQPVATSGVLQPIIPHQHLATFSPTLKHSAHTDQSNFNLLSPLAKFEILLHSVSPPSKTASLSTASTLFTKTSGNEKHPSVASPISIPDYFGHPQTTFTLTQADTKNNFLNQTLPIALPGKSASLSESTSPEGNRQSSITKMPLERLIKAVESLTPEAMSASVSEIVSVMNEVDMIAGIAYNDSEATAGEHLAAKVSCHLHAKTNVSLQYGCSFQKWMRRKIRAMPLHDLSSSLIETENLKQSTANICDLDSTENSRRKRRRIEANRALLDEIRYINHQLLETVLDLDSIEDAATPNVGEGIVVRCAYSAVALNENLKKRFSSWMLPVLPLRLLVPASYPNSSPVILDGLTLDSSCYTKESLDLSAKTKSRFSISLRKLTEPMSLAEIAMIWDTCARAVFLEYFQLFGAGCFSSRYGNGANCVTS